MRIAVNALFLRSGRVGGSEIALRGLVNGLARRLPGRQIRVYLPAAEAGRGSFGEGVEEVVGPVPTRPRAARIVGEQTWLPARLALDRADLLWNAGFTAPVATSIPQVTTVFDVQHLRHPEYFHPTHRLAWRVLVDLALARSRRIACPSKATLADLAALRPRHASKLRLVVLGVEDDWLEARPPEAAAHRRRLQLPEHLAVCVATTHPHKGHATVLRAWRALLDGGHAPPLLALTGVTGFADAAIRELTRELRLDAHVRHLGWLAREELREVVASADVALVPSQFEGFGLPLLEALALGVPTVASDLPVLREVGRDHVRWVKGHDEREWASAVKAILAMTTAERCEWAERARRAASAWTWDRASSALLEVFEQARRGGAVDGIERREV